ncbi:MAG: glycoside hydrolase family 5 protein [Pirellulales bacterium]|nr:glycoside hydrolase family 5 protein [Pirellulales bacterium]
MPRFTAITVCCLMALSYLPARANEALRWIVVSPDKSGFVEQGSGRMFTPWGFNYDHDEQGRLIEDYWLGEWPKVEADFAEMKALGANVVRVHLQFGKFMDEAARPSARQLDQLGKLFALAERVGIYLDLTGLGCYHRQDVPAWYDALSEADRWAAQAAFWEAIAARSADSPAVFCYDLMNEPVVPGGRRDDGNWLGPPFAGKHFVQFVTLDQADRERPDIAKAWVAKLVAAIRQHDRRHLVTVGLVDWSLDRPGLTSGFVPQRIAEELDFLAVHIYPERGKIDAAIETLRGFAIGKPVVIEETFPLKCAPGDFAGFIERSRQHAAGWIGFYWGRTTDECRKSGTIADALMLAWLEFFQRHAKAEP